MSEIQGLLVNAIDKSVSEMFTMMSTIEVQEATEAKLHDYITGCLQVHASNFNGLIKIEIEKNFATETVSDMTGVDAGDLNDKFIMDGVGELVNMITGFTKSKLREFEIGFDLTPPFIIYGTDYAFSFKESVRRDKVFYKSPYGDLVVEVITY